MTKSKIIAPLLAAAIMAAMLAACSSDNQAIDEPSESQSTQEAEAAPTPAPSGEPTPSQDTSPMPNEDGPSEEPTPSPAPASNEPASTQEPTPSQAPTPTNEPTTTQAPAPSQEPAPTATPTTPPTSTPVHTHSFKGGDCSTPSICECGEIGSYGDHDWITIHIDEYGYYEKGETHSVRFKQCDCGFTVNSDMPNATTIWDDHMIATMHSYITWREDVPNGEPKYIVVVEEHDEAYCSICGAIQ